MTTTMVTEAEKKQLMSDTKSIYAKYPKWMDNGDAVKTGEFKRIVQRAMKLGKCKSLDHDWIVNVRSLLRDHDELYRSLNDER